MDESQEIFIDSRLLQGAPLIPSEISEDEKRDAAITAKQETEMSKAHKETEQKTEMTTLAAQGKMAMRQAVLSGRAEEVLGTAVQFTEKTKEGIEVLQKVLGITKNCLNINPDAEGLSDLTTSQLELFWKFIQAPEFQNLTASLLAKILS
ncbi:MAG: hypothetical protein GX489_09905 [Firmicutes bacterium]|nr:hypothetical protein [Bacillota bacterium]